MKENKVNALYVHIPFCNYICHYCDFCKIFYDKDTVDNYLSQLEKQIKMLPNGSIETIYIGGGTPSSLSYEQLEYLMDILSTFVGTETIEFCIEMNPDFIDEKKLTILKKAGINRVSVGVQTFDDELLKSIGRKHCYNDIINIMNLLNKLKFDNVSFDMMYGLPNQSIDHIKNDLEKLNHFNIKHISYYSLILEEHTVFDNQNISQIDDQFEFECRSIIRDKLSKYDFLQYEVSNYSKKGYESKHNLKYWEYENYYGVGCGSVGKVDNKMFTTLKNVIGYSKGDMKIVEEIKTIEDTMFEHIMMSLRLVNGLDIKRFNSLYFVDFNEKYKDVLDKYNKYFIRSDQRIACTLEGIDLLHEILMDFL